MTRLEELLAAREAVCDAAEDAYYAARDAADPDDDDIWDAAAWKAVAALDVAAVTASTAYEAELKKIREEKQNE